MNTLDLIPILVNLAILGLVAALVLNYYKKRVSVPGERYSTFGPRFWAPSIDSVVLWPVMTLIPFVLVQLAPSSFVATSIFTTLVFYAYSIYFHGKRGGTIGKLKCKIRVVHAQSEEPIGYKQAFLRDCIPLMLSVGLYATALSQGGDLVLVADSQYFQIVPVVMLLWFLAEILTMLTNDKRRALHDFIAGTVVVRDEAKKVENG